jgi:phosphate uptake regulator
MGKHLLIDLDGLKKELLTSGSLVEEAVNDSIDALANRHIKLVKEVIKSDHQIN